MHQKRFLFLFLAGILALGLLLTLTPGLAKAWEIDGFVRNNTGWWTENWDYSDSNDPLATERNWLRLNLNGSLTSQLKLKAEVLACYETEYAREKHSGVKANEYNSFDFRELRLDWRPATGHTLRIGKQIVNWGESISARIGDVVNPTDTRFDLGFTNLEDTRFPIWMLRGLHQIYSIGTSIDWIFSPYMEPDRYRVNRLMSSAGTVNSDGSFTPSPRFAAYPETRVETKFKTHNAMIALQFGAPGYPFPVNLGTLVVPGPVFGEPFSSIYCDKSDLAMGSGPIPAAVATAVFGAAFAGTPYPAQAVYLMRKPEVTTVYPDASLEDSRFGLKTSSTLAGWQTGVYFWHSNEIEGVLKIRGGVPAPGMPLYIDVTYPNQNVYGFYANKNFDFGVVRLDAAYRPSREYATSDYAKHKEGVVKKDFLKAQLGFNKDFMIRSLNPNATFSFIGEYVLDYFPESEMEDIHVATYFVPLHRDSHTIFLSLGTNYNFGMYSYGLTCIHNFLDGGNGLVSPSFTYAPDWMNRKWSFKLAYTAIYGPDYAYPYGLMKEKDLVVLTTQFSFP